MPHDTVSASGQSLTESTLAPPEHLCALAEAAVRGEFAEAAFKPLDRALRDDALDREDLEILPLLAPILVEAVPDHPLIGIIQGLRRRSKVRVGMAEVVTRAIDSEFAVLGIPTMITGDFGAARELYPDPSERIVLMGTVIVPREVTREVRAAVIRRAADATGARILEGRRPGLERFGVRMEVRSSLSPAFGFPAARRLLVRSAELDAEKRLRPAPEVLVLESIHRSVLGAPRIRWFTDAVFASGLTRGIRWDVFMRAAEELAWTAPATEAMEVLAMRGWALPELQLTPDSPVDRAYWSTRQATDPGSPAARLRHRSWLAARMARNWLGG